MNLLPSADQVTLASTTAEFCTSRLPIHSIRDRRNESTAASADSWASAAELGLLGISADEGVGGAGLGLDDEALVFRELGRALSPGPFLGSVLGARVAAQRGDTELATAIIAGRNRVGLALIGHAELGPDGLSGPLRLLDAPGADYVLVLNSQGAGLLDPADLGHVEPVDCLDPGSRLSAAVADGAAIRHWVPSGEAEIWLHALLLVAALQVGVAEAARGLAIEHAKNRVQFDRPIGANQAIKHRCVDMAVSCDAALQQTLYAAVSLAAGHVDARFHVLAAKTVAGSAAVTSASEAIQVLGGIGYTWEHDIHLYLKRAHLLEHVFGSPREHLADLLAQQEPQ